MIELFYTNINQIPPEPALADWQRQKADSYKKREDALRSMAASLLLSAVLFGGEPEPPPLLGEYKKPYYEGKPQFNISHAGEYAVLALCPEPVGIDIEQSLDEDFMSLGKAFLCEAEYALLAQTEDKRTLFYKLWTRKESYLKMLGTGLHTEPKSVCVLSPPAGCNFFTRDIHSGYAICVCSADTVCAESFTLLGF